MARLGRMIMVMVVCAVLGGCTLHFKAKELELDAERQRIQNNVTYELQSAGLFDGEDRQ